MLPLTLPLSLCSTGRGTDTPTATSPPDKKSVEQLHFAINSPAAPCRPIANATNRHPIARLRPLCGSVARLLVIFHASSQPAHVRHGLANSIPYQTDAAARAAVWPPDRAGWAADGGGPRVSDGGRRLEPASHARSAAATRSGIVVCALMRLELAVRLRPERAPLKAVMINGPAGTRQGGDRATFCP